ncbi:MAG: methyltransferase domain-containing protein [Caulobacterales bacterium]
MHPAAKAILAESCAVLDGRAAYPENARTDAFGYGRSERCVEGPWAASWLRDRSKILDIGYALSSLDYLGLLLELKRRGTAITGVDIIRPERVATRYPAEWRADVLATPYLEGDIRTLDLPVAAFDAVACISTIEHVGFDIPSDRPDTAFARWEKPGDVPQKRDPNAARDVMAAIARALAPDGIAVITTPMGKGGPCLVQDSLGLWTKQQEADAAGWNEIIQAAGFEILGQRFFLNTWDGGWLEVDGPADLTDVTADGRPHAAGAALCALRRVGS